MKGFSLIELMIVVAIIAILATIGIPKYSDYILKNHRNEAVAELLSAANFLDSYEIRNGVFPSDSDINSFWPANTKNGYYNISYRSNEQNCLNVNYRLTAIAQGSQAHDTPCQTIELTVSGAVINKTPVECWSC